MLFPLHLYCSVTHALCITPYSGVIFVVSADEAHTVSRAECLERYREKKLRRLDVNTIRYMKRKINADRRPRELAFNRLHPFPDASLAGSCTVHALADCQGNSVIHRIVTGVPSGQCAGIKGRFVKAEELDAYRAGLLPGQDGIPLPL